MNTHTSRLRFPPAAELHTGTRTSVPFTPLQQQAQPKAFLPKRKQFQSIKARALCVSLAVLTRWWQQLEALLLQLDFTPLLYRACGSNNVFNIPACTVLKPPDHNVAQTSSPSVLNYLH